MRPDGKAASVKLLLANRIEIIMDGKGSWRDNVFVERLWRSVKHEEVYLKAYDSVTEARASLGATSTSTTVECPTGSTLTTCPRRWQHDLRRRYRAATGRQST